MYSTLDEYWQFESFKSKEHYSESVPILNLIVYDHNNPYEAIMKNTLTNYLITQKNVTFFFITLREQDVDIVKEEYTLFIKGTESHKPGILNKTIAGIKYCLEKKVPFKYFVRSNISTALQFSKFPYDEMKHHSHASTHVNKFPDFYVSAFASGTNIILDRDMVHYLVDHDMELDRQQFEDVAIGILLNQKSFPHQLQNQMMFQPHTDMSRFAYRHKSEDRFKDAEDMKELVKKFS